MTDPTQITYSVHDLLEMPSCRTATSVEPMAGRWCLQPQFAKRDQKDAAGHPARLVAPRFARVPPLRVRSPDPSVPHEVWVSGWASLGWFSHLRVGYPGAAFPVTVSSPRVSGRPNDKDAMRQARVPQLWDSYVLTLPAGVEEIEISKTDLMEAGLVGVTFRPCSGAAVPPPLGERPPADMRLIVAGILDEGILIAETLHTYQWGPVEEFLCQMRAMGFTDCFSQVYMGGVSWSQVARPVCDLREGCGHFAYANWNAPAYSCLGDVEGWRAHFRCIRGAGLAAVASFRINNEFLANWARAMYGGEVPPISSVFSLEHPEFWPAWKNGSRHGGGLDFAFSEVRQYRLSVLTEWCDKFDGLFDGICIDLHRHPPMVSYPEPLVREFQARTGIDVRTSSRWTKTPSCPSGWRSTRNRSRPSCAMSENCSPIATARGSSSPPAWPTRWSAPCRMCPLVASETVV